jgi:hypothetical protein
MAATLMQHKPGELHGVFATPINVIHVPNKINFALLTSPSGPVMVVSVCPQRGPGAASSIGNGRGLGTPVGLGIALSSSIKS